MDRQASGGSDRRWWTSPLPLVLVLTIAGAVVRFVVAHQSLFADELSTYWIVTAHGFGGVLSSVHSNDEITPPLYFVLSWLTTQFGHAPEWVRAPSLVAGTLTIPAVYALGARTVGRAPALLAAAVTTLSPFMIYYSTEARGYALVMLLVVLSTLSMLIAAETGRARWWVAYGATSCAAMYTHYTAAFALAAQLVWLFWAEPGARRAAVLANVGAVLAFAPWTSGLINDLNSPTTKILSALSPFNWLNIRISIGHLAVGSPQPIVRLRQLPGTIALALLGVAAVVALVGGARALAGRRGRLRFAEIDRRLVLIALLALSVPVGEAIVSLVGTNLFSTRNLAASWPTLALLASAALMAAAPLWRYAAALLVVTAFAFGAGKMLESRYGRPDYKAGAEFIGSHAQPGDAVVDGSAAFSPGPLSPYDVAVGRKLPVFRANAPSENTHPYGFNDPITPAPQAIASASAAARPGGRIYAIVPVPVPVGRVTTVLDARTREIGTFPKRFRLLGAHLYPGIYGIKVEVYRNP
jgi:4-amino-4-deoxy-L-arabinose transferase-like glycosyltransferase